MNRRDFLWALRGPVTLAAAIPAVAAATSPPGADHDRLAALRRECARLRLRVRCMDAAHRRAMRLALGLAGVAIGIDLTLLV
jgi:hypothetical protein